MKIWKGYGSEHSMNLVMIGQFKSARHVEDVEKLIQALVKHATDNDLHDSWRASPDEQRFSDEILEFLGKHKLYSLSPTELGQFAYEANIEKDGLKLVLTTDEADISGYLKLFVENGARVEIYSAHDYPNSEHGRGR